MSRRRYQGTKDEPPLLHIFESASAFTRDPESTPFDWHNAYCGWGEIEYKTNRRTHPDFHVDVMSATELPMTAPLCEDCKSQYLAHAEHVLAGAEAMKQAADKIRQA